MLELSDILEAGAFLINSTSSSLSSDLKGLLLARLSQYYLRLGKPPTDRDPESITLHDARLETADQALCVIERVQCILIINRSSGAILGVRDLTQLRTLLSIVFHWSVEPLLARVAEAWSNGHHEDSTTNVTVISEDYKLLYSTTQRILSLIFPSGLNGPPEQTEIIRALLNSQLSDILKPSLALGWIPKSLSSVSTPTADEIRQLSLRLLNMLPPSETIVALGAVIGAKPAIQHVSKACAVLLSKQLMRPDGIIGLCEAVFGVGADNHIDAPLQKLEHFARVLCTIPSGMKTLEYYETIVPRVVAVLSKNVSHTHIRAAAFALSRMLDKPNRRKMVLSILLPILHSPILILTRNLTVESSESHVGLETSLAASQRLGVKASLQVLQTLLINVDPSPTFISSILSPVTPSLYTLAYRLETVKTSDPTTREFLGALLKTWGRVIGVEEGLGSLWAIMRGEGGEWETDIEGEIRRVEQSASPQSLSLLTPEDLLQGGEMKGLDPDTNFLNLRPDPIHFARFLGSIDRPDIISAFFVQILEAYRNMKSQPDTDPLQTLLYVQLIIQMQSHITNSSNFFQKPLLILNFIKNVLASYAHVHPNTSVEPTSKPKDGLSLEDLRIVPISESEDLPEQDEEDAGTLSVDTEILDTAINFLLAFLEANTELSPLSTPELNDIFLLLEPIAKDASNVHRPLAREAIFLMTARSASYSGRLPKHRSEGTGESVQETYQKALKLLQDPILPVRAHGLLLLRQLVSNRDKPPGPELLPGILSIFLQSLEDADSYIFLNAVQGLTAMVGSFGRDVLTRLLDVYAGGLQGMEGTHLTSHDIDKRTRMGEALGQVIQNSGTALRIHVDLLVPTLLRMVRASHLPTTLRTSALSLLAECAKTDHIALLRYLGDCIDGMIDLLQLESDFSSSTDNVDPNRETDLNPASTNSKIPSLRRAALHFLALIIRSVTNEVSHDIEAIGRVFQRGVITRARTTIAYIASTDKDNLVKTMARETVEMLDDLGRSAIWY